MLKWASSDGVRPIRSKIEDELSDLAVEAPLTNELMSRVAPEVTARLGNDGASALKLLRAMCDADRSDKFIDTVRTALGFNDDIRARSKQQRLSDLAPFYNRTGWRNMERWFRAGVERLAGEILQDDGWPRRVLNVVIEPNGERSFNIDFTASGLLEPEIEAVEVSWVVAEDGDEVAQTVTWFPEYRAEPEFEGDDYGSIEASETIPEVPLGESTELTIHWHSKFPVTLAVEVPSAQLIRTGIESFEVQANARYALIKLWRYEDAPTGSAKTGVE